VKYLIKYFIDFAVLGFLYAFVFFRRWRTQGRDILLVNTLMYAYLSLVLYFTMMPVAASIPFMLDHPYKPMNLVPFIDVSLGRGDFFRQVLLNVIMTLPFGFLFPLIRAKRAKFGATVFFCFLMSLGIELLQPFFDRSSDITDLITNVTGGVLGYGLYLIFKPVAFWILKRLKTR
jgi:glycopeptide antibiotics resistance protein